MHFRQDLQPFSEQGAGQEQGKSAGASLEEESVAHIMSKLLCKDANHSKVVQFIL